MALVKIEEFNGSILGNLVMETLEIVGVINSLNTRQYGLSLTGVQEPTPRGLIDDEPKYHIAKIEKIIYIGKRQQLAFVKGTKVDDSLEDYKSTIKTLGEADIQFGLTMGITREEKKSIVANNDGTCWYRHSLELVLNQENRTAEEYVKYMLEAVANMVVSSK